MLPQNGTALPADGRSLTSCWDGRQRGNRRHTDALPAVPAHECRRRTRPHAGAIAARAGYPVGPGHPARLWPRSSPLAPSRLLSAACGRLSSRSPTARYEAHSDSQLTCPASSGHMITMTFRAAIAGKSAQRTCCFERRHPAPPPREHLPPPAVNRCAWLAAPAAYHPTNADYQQVSRCVTASV
jgi:hypothetical protein